MMLQGNSRVKDWRILPDKNRRNGSVVKYTLSEDELKKYQEVKSPEIKKPIFLEVGDEVRKRRIKQEGTKMKNPVKKVEDTNSEVVEKIRKKLIVKTLQSQELSKTKYIISDDGIEISKENGGCLKILWEEIESLRGDLQEINSICNA